MTVADFWMIDGTLEPIDFDGYADDRFPFALAERVIETFSKKGDWVLDPFAGLGTTVFAAARLGRNAIGFETDPQRARYVTSRLTPPHRLIAEPIQTITQGQFPPFDLIFTSPPYVTVNLEDDPWGPTYFDDMRDIFTKLSRLMAPTGRIVVEVSNVSTEDGFRPLIAELGDCLRDVFPQTGEIVRINTGPALAGPGTRHSSLLVFAPS